MADRPRVAEKIKKTFRKRVAARLGVAAALGTALVLVSASAASASWLDETTPTPAGATVWSFAAVSCTTPNQCEAVGSSDNTSDGLLAESRSGTTWTQQTMPDPGAGNLTSVSCTAVSACTAVGDWYNGTDTVTLAERWDGGAWTVQATPSPSGASSSELNRVSCVSATSCVAVGDSLTGSVTSTLAETWNGTSWTIQSTPNVSGEQTSQLNGLSCTSASACTAVGYAANSGTGQPLAEAWNGSSWSIQTTPSPTGSFSQLNGVSCPSATDCTAVGDGFAEVWNGTSWSVQTIARSKDDLASVSCVAGGSHCTAVGGTYREGIQYMVAESWSGTKWTENTVPISTSYDTDVLSDVSCQNTTACTAVGTYHDPVDGNRGLAEVLELRWHPAVAVVPTGGIATGLQTVSCVSTSSCMAVGNYEGSGSTFYALAESWNGGSWTVQNVPSASTSDFSGVSCTVKTACTVVGDAVGGGGGLVTLAERWNGSTWTVQSTPNPAGAVDSYLTSVSCTSATACTAVGLSTDGSGNRTLLAESWDGSSWTLQSTPDPGGSNDIEFNTVSCASASACVAVGFYLSPSYTPLAEVWNGTSWTMQNPSLPGGGSDGTLGGVSCTAKTACIAVGNYYDGSKTVTLAERWNGSAWAVQATPNEAGAKDNYLSSVSCVSATSCEATGSVYKGGAVPTVTLSEHWDGKAWHPALPGAPAGAIQSDLTSVSCLSGSNCMGVGWYYDSSSTELPLYAPFN